MSLLTSLPNVLYNINPGSTDPKMILLKNIYPTIEAIATTNINSYARPKSLARA